MLEEPQDLRAPTHAPTLAPLPAPGTAPHPDLVWIPGGTFLMGSEAHYPEEAPVHPVGVSGFWMDRFTVTNMQFQRFVEATKYLTVAERPLNPEDYPGAKPGALVPGSLVFRKAPHPVSLANWQRWWDYVPGASWRHPEGPQSNLKGRGKHPVVHVAYEDVEAYAAWAGKQVPTEAEWECAARGGLEGAEFCWGSELRPAGRPMANIWEGEFPWQNLKEDGYEGTAPVGSYPPNGYGLHDMAGNVWEWTQDFYAERHAGPATKACCIPQNPRNAAREASRDPAQPHIHIPRRVLKGGSHLCAFNYCRRYRPAARSPQQVDSGACHIGFRLVLRPEAH
ncbi:formylglycine-generating enzyme family protein [Aggregicoccus sp. 17bor-14]|uniref:formylglycine-generating enzyme family protein n=1 Tax=Myxococcaceae TaxID=31 RepID=UPI00129D088E|nr:MULTISPECIES: formylglycine-generating enzyme family protein [Myxococcaceae]MBF5043116.1 formylglycine-generating enzyme family protein [Simulacricoccus sp. 17bor-14]MRI88878.1 formylglycine-generating enzyme family protein [Aggregicoccus sp. 17bor-14]